MALLERVATLMRANLNDLIDKAEDPEKMIKQVILDMQNQLLQVKTQVAIAIADQHLLMKKQKEGEDSATEWVRKAELAVEKGQDDLARHALVRSMAARESAGNFAVQVADQTAQVENLKTALRKLDLKLAEARDKSDVLIAQHRRSRALARAGPGFARVEAVVRSVFRVAARRPELLGLLREVSRLGPPATTRLTEALEPLVARPLDAL